MKIAIDGPAGAGKSTIAKLIARKLGFVYIDTGAMYRAITWKSLQEGIKPGDAEALDRLLYSTDIHFEQTHDNQKVICDGQDISEEIRSPLVSSEVPTFASIKKLREVMVNKQKDMAGKFNVVMDGRDIGEQVLPDADFKFFVTASLEERAKRRIQELKNKGYPLDEDAVKKDMGNRDRMDSEREVGALKILADSIVIDSSELSVKEVLEKMLLIIKEGHNAV